MNFFGAFKDSKSGGSWEERKKERKKEKILQADAHVWLDLLQSVTTAVSSLFFHSTDQLPVSSDMKKSWLFFLQHAGVFFLPSTECQVVYWLPLFWLAALRANLTAGRWMELNDESVCFKKVFLFQPERRRAGGKSPPQHAERLYYKTEVAKLLFSPSGLFLFFLFIFSSGAQLLPLSLHFLLCFLPTSLLYILPSLLHLHPSSLLPVFASCLSFCPPPFLFWSLLPLLIFVHCILLFNPLFCFSFS